MTPEEKALIDSILASAIKPNARRIGCIAMHGDVAVVLHEVEDASVRAFADRWLRDPFERGDVFALSPARAADVFEGHAQALAFTTASVPPEHQRVLLFARRAMLFLNWTPERKFWLSKSGGRSSLTSVLTSARAGAA